MLNDPVIERFLGVDPILKEKSPTDIFELHNGRLHGESPYTYTFNNPLNSIDPDGKFNFLLPAIPVAIKGAAAVYAATKATVVTTTTAAGAYIVYNVS